MREKRPNNRALKELKESDKITLLSLPKTLNAGELQDFLRFRSFE